MKVRKLQVAVEVGEVNESCDDSSGSADVVASSDVVERASPDRPVNGDHLRIEKFSFHSKLDSSLLTL